MIYLVEDDESIRELVVYTLNSQGLEAQGFERPSLFWKALEKELLTDEKELAEHNMLVDLGRNDLGKISRFGTVKVEKLHSVERFSHVMHIARYPGKLDRMLVIP